MDRDTDVIIQEQEADVSVESSTECRSGTIVDTQTRHMVRKPFHFRSHINTASTNPSSPDIAPSDQAEEATYSRFKYYQRLRGPPCTDSTLLIPDHVVPSMFFYPYIPGTSPCTGKQSSLITIFAVWNTMMGTSLLSMPWAIERAGVVAGLLLILFMAAVCLYTAYRNLQVYSVYGEKENLDDFPDLCQHLLGRFGQVIAVIFSALSLLGASIVYWVLMSNFLYNTVKYIHNQMVYPQSPTADSSNSTFNLICPSHNMTDASTVDRYGSDLTTFDKVWDLDLTVPIYLAVLLLPILCLKSATFFTKFNALGTLSVFYIVSFVITKSCEWGWNVDLNDPQSPFYVPLYRPSFPALSGMLALALYLHNCVVSIMKNNRQQENNARDLSVAYTMVASTYMFIGAVFFLTFPLDKGCIEDNFLNNFPQSDVLTVVARIFLLFQMTTVFPLLAYILRTQILYALFNSTYPSFLHVSVLNVILICICVLFAIFLPRIGTITRFSGALCGLVYIFTLPCILHIVSLRKQNNGKWPIGATIIHCMIIACGVLNLVAQFVVQ